MQCAVCSVQCAVCSVQCAVCSVQCAVCSVQCAVCSVQCAVCSDVYFIHLFPDLQSQLLQLAVYLIQPLQLWPVPQEPPNSHHTTLHTISRSQQQCSPLPTTSPHTGLHTRQELLQHLLQVVQPGEVRCQSLPPLGRGVQEVLGEALEPLSQDWRDVRGQGPGEEEGAGVTYTGGAVTA